MIEIRKEIIIGALIIALAILGYGYLNYRQKMEVFHHEGLEKIYRDTQLQACLGGAFERYTDRWKGHCLKLGKKADCQLPMLVGKGYEESLKEDEDRCVKIWAD